MVNVMEGTPRVSLPKGWPDFIGHPFKNPGNKIKPKLLDGLSFIIQALMLFISYPKGQFDCPNPKQPFDILIPAPPSSVTMLQQVVRPWSHS
jgi:hypothetical protein